MSIYKDLKDFKDMKEIKVEEYLVRRAALAGGSAKKLAEEGRRGFSDRTLMLPYGYIAFVELKRPKGGVISEHQKEHSREMLNLGMRQFTACTYEEVDNIFDDYTNFKEANA